MSDAMDGRQSLPTREVIMVPTPAREWGCDQLMNRDGDTDVEFDTLVELLSDEYARGVLLATSQEPMTVPELSERMDVSRSTLYRRVDRLSDAGLIDKQTRPRTDGHHETVYAAVLESLSVELDEGSFACRITRTEEDAADRLQLLWSDL